MLALVAGLPERALAQDQQPTVQPPSQAPPKAEPKPETPAIVITGSRIPRTNLTAVSPVTMVTQQEIKLQGATNTEELLNALPQITPSEGAFLTNGATGTASIQLRELGEPRTLVLLNGHRLGPGSPDFPFPDVNNIPPSLIQRIDVLTGGASSVYGSDAVAGVVNIILDTHFNGVRLDAQASVFEHDNRNDSGLVDAIQARGFGFPRGQVADGARQDVNISFGRGFLGGRGHLALYVGYRKLRSVTQDRRDYSACAADLDDDTGELICGGSPASFPANFQTQLGDIFQVGPDRTFEPGFSLFNFAPTNYFQRPDRRYTAGAFADLEISQSVHPYLEAMFMDDRSVAQIAPSGDFGNTTTINCDNPLLSPQQRSLVCVAGNFVGETIDENGDVTGSPTKFIDPITGAPYLIANLEIDRRNVEGGGRQEDLRHKNGRLLAGLKGDVGRGVTYDTSYIYGRATLHAAHLNDFSKTRLARALDVVTDPQTGQPACRSALTGEDPECVPWDVFAFNAVTPAAVSYLQVPSVRTGKVSEQVANANATVDLGEWALRSPWAEEPPAINVGAEYRRDRLDYKPDELALSGDLAGNSSEDVPLHGSTDVKEIFAEARIPLIAHRFIERLAFEGGYRLSWYRAQKSSVSTSAYKLALDLTPVRGLRLRASQQRAVRAPNIIELFSPQSTDAFDEDPCEGATPEATAEQCALTGVSAAQYRHILPIPPGSFRSYNAITGGNSELEPEKATTRTAGVVLEPRFVPGFSTTLDWWDIRLDGAIQIIGARTILETCLSTGDSLFCNRIHRDSNGSLWRSPEGFIDDRNVNIGELHVRGIDLGASYSRKMGRFGSINAELNGSYMGKADIDNGGLSEPFECAGLYGFPCGTPFPKWRHKARLTWQPSNPLTLSLLWRHSSSMKLAAHEILGFEASPLVAKLPSADFFDFTTLLKVSRNFTFRLGASNIFDREPPMLPGALGSCDFGCSGNTYPQWYDPLGRRIFVGVSASL